MYAMAAAAAVLEMVETVEMPRNGGGDCGVDVAMREAAATARIRARTEAEEKEEGKKRWRRRRRRRRR